jgi:hypothetical protein
MARKLSPKEASAVKFEQTTRYPWADWTNGDTWELTKDDFNGGVPQFRNQCKQIAKRRGLVASVMQLEDKIYVKFTGQQTSESVPSTDARA